MKVIFLDVDGVLNSDEYIKRTIKSNIQGIEKHVDVEKIKLLRQAIVQTNAKVVLTSSWRLTKMAQELIKLLITYGIYADSTPYIRNERGLEIKQWLVDNQNVEDFVILDDEIFESYDEGLMKKLVKISNGNGHNFGEGLLPKDIDEIIKRLGRNKTRQDDEMER